MQLESIRGGTPVVKVHHRLLSPLMTRVVALYCRLSPRPDGEYEGVETQEQWGRAYAAKTWPGVPIEVFADAGVSAAGNDHRPGYEALKAAIIAGRVAHLWAVEQTRLERREVQWFELAAMLDAAGIDAVHTNRDGVVRVRDDVAGIKAVLAAGEVRRLKRRVRDKMETLAAEGRPPGASVFGYRHGLDEQGRKALLVVPEQAEAIRWAADAILGGWSLTAVADELDARGFRGALGARIRVGSVRSFMTSPTIAGRRVHRGVEVGPGTWEPILSLDVWRAVRARLAGPRTIRTRDGRGHEVTPALFAGNRGRTGRSYLLTGGLAVCAVCGAPLAGAKVTRYGATHPYLRCTPARGGKSCVGIRMTPVDEHVRDELFARLDTPAFLDALAADEHGGRRDELTAALDVIETERRPKLATLWAAGTLTDAEWAAARAALDEQEDALRREHAALPAPAHDVDALLAMRTAWPGMTLGEQREFVRLFIERVVVDRADRQDRSAIGSRVKIVWRQV